MNVKTNSVLSNRWKLLPVVLLGPFMGSLDASIMNVALPTISKSFSISLDQTQWMVSSYLIVISALILTFGQLADRIGRSKVFIAGFAVFGAGSLFCSLAWSLETMIIARSIQALGASMFMASNQALIAVIFPPNERGRALGFLGTTVAIGTMVGPPLGGMIVSYLGWPYLFYINIPISLFTFLVGLKYLPKEELSFSLDSIDLGGSLFFIVSTVSLFYFILDGQSTHWHGMRHLIALGVFAVASILFIVIEKIEAHPLLDFDLFNSAIFSISIASVLIVFCASFSINITQPYYLQDVVGLTALKAGLVLLILPLASALVAPFAGYLSDRLSPEPLTLLGLVMLAGALSGLIFLKTDSSLIFVISLLFIFGVGIGFFNSPNTKLIMTHVPHTKLGVARSLNALVRNIGMVSGIALAVGITSGSMKHSAGALGGNAISIFKDDYIRGVSNSMHDAGTDTHTGYDRCYRHQTDDTRQGLLGPSSVEIKILEISSYQKMRSKNENKDYGFYSHGARTGGLQQTERGKREDEV